MYVPDAFSETRVEILHPFIEAHSLGALVVPTSRGLEATHVPFTVHAEPAPYGTLRGHIARANALWRDQPFEDEILVIFKGPDAYVSPSWYPTKKSTGEVVPTWNYAVAHAYGRLEIETDPAWLREVVEGLTLRQEAGRPEPWRVDDAPRAFVDRMLRAIVGIEIRITRLVGSWKLSQNRSEADRNGVVEGLRAEPTAHATRIADLVRDPRAHAPE